MAPHRTIQDLAREAKVSVSTIDRIISGRGTVKRSTIEHVLATAEKISFYGSEAIRARLHSTGEERVFGFLLNSHTRSLYRSIAAEITTRVSRSRGIHGRVIVTHVEDLDARKTAAALRELGMSCNAVACLCIDHPEVNAAIKELAGKGIPVVCMISDVSAQERAGFIGANDWQLGRTAGWFMQRLCKPGAKVAPLMGSERYLCQQAQESSFRNFLRASSNEFALLDTHMTYESDLRAEEVAIDLLNSNCDLGGIFLAGGGVDGIADAMKKLGREDVIFISTELSIDARDSLMKGVMDIALDHPVRDIAQAAVDAMISLTTSAAEQPRFQQILPFRVLIGENC